MADWFGGVDCWVTWEVWFLWGAVGRVDCWMGWVGRNAILGVLRGGDGGCACRVGRAVRVGGDG